MTLWRGAPGEIVKPNQRIGFWLVSNCTNGYYWQAGRHGRAPIKMS